MRWTFTKSTAARGQSHLFKSLPQSPATPPGAGLGNIAYDCAHKNFYVSDIDDGLIYRLDLAGNTLSTWDHGLNLPTANPPSAAIPDDPMMAFTHSVVEFGVCRRTIIAYIMPCGGRTSDDPTRLHANEVWSIALNSSGDFVPGTDQIGNQYAGRRVSGWHSLELFEPGFGHQFRPDRHDVTCGKDYA